jgi:ABC-2 type transport system ATP-binding protein
LPIIEVQDLSKIYNRSKQFQGRLGWLRSFVSRETEAKVAVDHLSFTVERGELLGYLGPNGAGKSTTIKMMTGVLVPTSGEVKVAGLVPYRDRQRNAQRIGVVFGQRSQLWWDLPTIESFELLRHMYRVPLERYRRKMAQFDEILELGQFLTTPVRQLSLGQRMRADLAAAFLHEPEIVFLDEPTIGLDVVAKDRIRQFIRSVNQERGTTVVLTTHDMADIEQLCHRIMVIDQGHIILDGSIETIRERFGKERVLVVDFESDPGVLALDQACQIRSEGTRRWLSFDRRRTTAAQLIHELTDRYPVKDLTIKEPEIEGIIRRIYQQGAGD